MNKHLDEIKTFGQLQTQKARDARNLHRLAAQTSKTEAELEKPNLPKSEHHMKKGSVAGRQAALNRSKNWNKVRQRLPR